MTVQFLPNKPCFCGNVGWSRFVCPRLWQLFQFWIWQICFWHLIRIWMEPWASKNSENMQMERWQIYLLREVAKLIFIENLQLSFVFRIISSNVWVTLAFAWLSSYFWSLQFYVVLSNYASSPQSPNGIWLFGLSWHVVICCEKRKLTQLSVAIR